MLYTFYSLLRLKNPPNILNLNMSGLFERQKTLRLTLIFGAVDVTWSVCGSCVLTWQMGWECRPCWGQHIHAPDAFPMKIPRHWKYKHDKTCRHLCVHNKHNVNTASQENHCTVMLSIIVLSVVISHTQLKAILL